MNARDKLIQALAYDSLGGLATEQDVTTAETLVDAYRAEVLRDAKRGVVAWLAEKACEYGTSNRENRAKAEAVYRMADKVNRGAIRLFLAAEEKASAPAPTATPEPGELLCQCGHGKTSHRHLQSYGGTGCLSCTGGGSDRAWLHAYNPAAEPVEKATPQPDVRAFSDSLTNLAQAHSAHVTADGDSLHLDLVAAPDEWDVWADELGIDHNRTTNRGGSVTSHATWHDIPLTIRCTYTGGA